MDRRDEPEAFVPNASIAIGQLIIKLRKDGLLTNDDVQAVLRRALANAAPAISAAVPALRSGLAAE